MLEERSEPLQKLKKELHESERPIVLEKLAGSALPFVLSNVLRTEKRPILVLTAGMERAEDIVGDLEFFGVANAMHYPKWEVLPYDEDDLSIEVAAKSLDVFEAIARKRLDPKAEPFAIAAPVDAAMLKVLPEERMKELTVRIQWGDLLDPAKLGDRLQAAGYTREPIVEARGEFSVRGGIIDIYPLNAEFPLRIDLFGEEIESIRTFDIQTQRSLDDLGTEANLIIPPARFKSQMLSYIQEGGALETLFEHLPEDTLVLLESPERFQEVCSYYENAIDRQYEIAKKNREDAPEPDKLIVRAEALPRRLERFRRIEHSLYPPEKGRKAVHVPFEQANYAAEVQELDAWLGQIRKLQSQDYLVAVTCDNDGQVQRFDELLREHEINAVAVYTSGWTEGFELKDVLKGYQDVMILVGGQQTGFALPDVRLCLMTDREIFGRYKRRYVYKKIYKGKPIQTSGDIRRGDYVVHVDHGIGRFLGMRVQKIDERMVDLIEIEYADGNKLLVPVEKIQKVQKYSGPEAAEPKLDKLGSNKWAKRREKHSAEIEKLAEELLELYAARETASREPHKPDQPLQREFEASFLYQETPDQQAAIDAAKVDMEKPRPMDRLVCGDVGYGKTEVAIRAIFKCIQSGHQAAVLCPTTILAQQHYNNFRERFADFPIKLEMVSRFRKPADVREVKKKMRSGELDVVVGTHALLSKDVSFKDLGLVVVDEEQRFGVRAKERLKEMRKEVDLMTMSATPIPRTLHMAMSGLRDLSIITTPPPDRQPIKTRVIHFEEEQIAEAILRELNRGGQVYFVHNRVKSIHEVVQRLKEIVPHARITHAHGQMKESELEGTMLKFIDQQYDILVSTTIIESGVDIPNCNTIIINRADAFGLAQLYQLRGRVGRERRRAYAYLIVPQGRGITETAVKRLQAIEDFAELGSGFSIAMRDMEIRGAGDLLGKQQHGTITDIGFELFCDLLAEKVEQRRGYGMRRPHEVEIRWDASVYLPPPYIPLEAQRVTFYKRFASAFTRQEVDDIASEVEDRFGKMPDAALNLVESYRVRTACQPLRIAAIKKSANKIRLTFIDPVAQDREPEFREAIGKIETVKSILRDSFDQLVLTMDSELDSQAAMVELRKLLEGLGESKQEAIEATG